MKVKYITITHTLAEPSVAAFALPRVAGFALPLMAAFVLCENER